MTTHSIVFVEASNSLARSGSATLTIVVSRMSMNSPSTKATATTCLYVRRPGSRPAAVAHGGVSG